MKRSIKYFLWHRWLRDAKNYVTMQLIHWCTFGHAANRLYTQMSIYTYTHIYAHTVRVMHFILLQLILKYYSKIFHMVCLTKCCYFRRTSRVKYCILGRETAGIDWSGLTRSCGVCQCNDSWGSLLPSSFSMKRFLQNLVKFNTLSIRRATYLLLIVLALCNVSPILPTVYFMFKKTLKSIQHFPLASFPSICLLHPNFANI